MKSQPKQTVMEWIWDVACSLAPFVATGVIVAFAIVGAILLREEYKTRTAGSPITRCEAFCAPSAMKNLHIYGSQTNCECEPRPGCGIELRPSTLMAPMLNDDSVICIGSSPQRCVKVRDIKP